MGDKSYSIFHKSVGGLAISNENAFDNDTVSDRSSSESDDMPFLSLAVDSLTNYSEARGGSVDLRAEDAAANDALSSASENDFIPTNLDRDAESKLAGGSTSGIWGRVRNYFGF